jgi:hypothetical protein
LHDLCDNKGPCRQFTNTITIATSEVIFLTVIRDGAIGTYTLHADTCGAVSYAHTAGTMSVRWGVTYHLLTGVYLLAFTLKTEPVIKRTIGLS